MRFLFQLGHPAHFHLFRHTISALRDRGHDVDIVIKTKDVLERLLDNHGWPYRNILEGGRGPGYVRAGWSVVRRDAALLALARANRPDVMAGTAIEITHVGRLLRIPSLVVNEDDHDVVPHFARLAYPFASCILAPACCRVGRWRGKTVRYHGYHELAYLHPNHFTPDRGMVEELTPDGRPYFVLRLAGLTAHHDAGRAGLHDAIVARLVATLAPAGHVWISAERELSPRFERYRLRIDPLHMHHVLAFAALYIGDSQTMAAEAAVLGTPGIRFNDFVGEIGYLEELEHRYGLTIGIRANQPERLLDTVRGMLADAGLRQELSRRREHMLSERIDTAAFLRWFVEEYPRSREAMQASRTDVHIGSVEVS